MQNGNWEDRGDSVLPFQLAEAGVRGRAVRLGELLGELLGRRDYPHAIEAAVAETVVLAALIGQIINIKWKLSLQVRGDGPIRLITSDYIAPEREGGLARIRSFASFDADRVGQSNLPATMFGKGYLAVLVDRGDGSQPYQGLVPLEGRSLAECAVAYFMLSEQLPTRFALSANRPSNGRGSRNWQAGGIMIQHMPSPSSLRKGSGMNGSACGVTSDEASEETDEEIWKRVCTLLETTDDCELTDAGVPLTQLLFRLFHEEKLRIYDWQPLRFGCTCSAVKVMQGLSIYSAKDIAKMTTAEGIVTADCQFCGAHYEFNPAHLGFEGTSEAGGGDC